jgi:DNA (cytosine-5)-methyltransferase 1
MNELALFAGAGGGILGGHLLGWKTVCAVEQDTYAASVLVARQNDGTLPPFPIWDDVCTFDGKAWKGIVEVVSGGFPCQDISVNGKGYGLEGERSGLWSEMQRICREVGPETIFVENSPMLVSRGLATVLWDLADMGYDAKWGCISADDMGAPHRRERIWIVAHSNSVGRKGNLCKQQIRSAKPSVQGSFAGTFQRWIDIPEPYGLRSSNGVAFGMDRIRCLGNGQVPRVAAAAFNILSGGIK